MNVLINEVVALYEAFSKDETPSLPELPIQYADFARWQHEWLTGDVLATQLRYWQKQLDDVATLQLPTDRPRPLIRSPHGLRQNFALPRDLSEALIRLARAEGVTLFTVLLAAWQTLLARYTEQTDIVVGSPIANRNRVETESLIGFLSEAEERQLVYDWNAVAPYSTPKRLLHELFEDQAERTPGNVALVLDDEKLTYSELNAQANDLAQHLHELGVGPETLVGLFMERSIEMVVAVLGILKAGGAYVPLDIEHPKERLAFMLDDARPPVLLTQRRLIDRLPELKAVQAVCIDELSSRDGVRVQRQSGDAPLRPRGESPADVIYTSGSTGTPKGVLVGPMLPMRNRWLCGS
ncbi:MAG TPA: AMP-binding protein [Pyrinomonadaceae bacterium]|nr:AMP-binding protein [Pyrinomonadaceae bacterium]